MKTKTKNTKVSGQKKKSAAKKVPKTRYIALREILQMTGLSKEQFAEGCGIRLGLFNIMESGAIPVYRDQANAIAAFTGCNRDALMENKAMICGKIPYTPEYFTHWTTHPVSSESVSKWTANINAGMNTTILRALTVQPPENAPHMFRSVVMSIILRMGDMVEEYGLEE